MTAKELLRSLISDVEAMRCQAPRCFECMSPEDQEHWFGPFENVFDGHFQWPNLGILIEKAKQQLRDPDEPDYDKPFPDPAAIFGVAMSLHELEKTKTLNVSDTFSGADEFMRVCMRVGEAFEKWACKHVDFTQLTDVWPYMMQDKFLRAYERAFGRITSDDQLWKLTELTDDHFQKIWEQLLILQDE